jgi:hypothetical protein
VDGDGLQWLNRPMTQSLNCPGLAFAGEHFADSMDHVALVIGDGEEFEAVTQALAVADDGTNFQSEAVDRQRNLQGDDFAGFEVAGECSADAVLAEFGGASPATAEFAILEHADLHAGIDGEAREAARVGLVTRGFDRFHRRHGREFFAWGGHEIQWSVFSGQCLVVSC